MIGWAQRYEHAGPHREAPRLSEGEHF